MKRFDRHPATPFAVHAQFAQQGKSTVAHGGRLHQVRVHHHHFFAIVQFVKGLVESSKSPFESATKIHFAVFQLVACRLGGRVVHIGGQLRGSRGSFEGRVCGEEGVRDLGPFFLVQWVIPADIIPQYVFVEEFAVPQKAKGQSQTFRHSEPRKRGGIASGGHDIRSHRFQDQVLSVPLEGGFPGIGNGHGQHGVIVLGQEQFFDDRFVHLAHAILPKLYSRLSGGGIVHHFIESQGTSLGDQGDALVLFVRTAPRAQPVHGKLEIQDGGHGVSKQGLVGQGVVRHGQTPQTGVPFPLQLQWNGQADLEFGIGIVGIFLGGVADERNALR